MDKIVTKDDERPAGKEGECFYCQSPIGQEHKPTCVIPQRTVRVRMTIDYEIQVPAFWEGGDIEFHRNDGTWCTNNAMKELAVLADGEDTCLCRHAKYEYLGEVEGADQ